jgi:hypothetical protein
MRKHKSKCGARVSETMTRNWAGMKTVAQASMLALRPASVWRSSFTKWPKSGLPPVAKESANTGQTARNFLQGNRYEI